MNGKAFMIICVAAVLTGCKKVSGEDLVPIGFEDMAVTKALVSDGSAVKTLSLYGFCRDREGQDLALFDNETLSYDFGKWSYTGGTRYWAIGYDYSFMGIYPQNDGLARDGRTVTLSSFETKKYQPGQQQDLLVGCHHRDLAATEDTSPVPLQMKHILSGLDFRVRNTSTEEKLELTNISITGVYTNGSCEITPKEGQSDISVTWTTGGSQLTDKDHFKGVDISSLGSGAESSIFSEKLLVLPQAITDKVVLNITISSLSDGSSYSKSIKLSKNVTEWEPGRTYSYVVSASYRYISLDLVVNDWKDDVYDLK